MESLRIGCVKYLNARPLISGWPGKVVLDHPAALCAQLARNDLDVALVSSFEFLRNPIYRIVDGVSISSTGAVYSVVVVHCSDIADIEEIELDPAAETSGNLLRCLLAELELPARVTNRSSSSIMEKRARLLIGDQAIRFRQEHKGELHFWDLGEQWNKLVGLPFVYALWLVRPEIRDLKSIAEQLRKLRDANLCDLGELIGKEKDFEQDFCDRYYREHLRFSFGEKEKEGLQMFAKVCATHALLPKRDLSFNLL